MNLTDKQINTFYDTLIKIIEDRENVKIEYKLKENKDETKKKRTSSPQKGPC